MECVESSPTTVNEIPRTTRRRSLFDKDNDNIINSQTKYPGNYIEKLKEEFEEWVTMAGQVKKEKKELKQARLKLKTTTFTEDIFTQEQKDYFAGIKKKVEDYYARVLIMKTMMEIEQDNEQREREQMERLLKLVDKKIKESLEH